MFAIKLLLQFITLTILTFCHTESSKPSYSARRIRDRLDAEVSTGQTNDLFESFGLLDRFLFSRFAESVAGEIQQPAAKSYFDLMEQINSMNREHPQSVVHEKGKRMLTKLFPPWLLPQYKWMFSGPFPNFSARMNTWVTHWTTNWLMGNSTVIDLQLGGSAGLTLKEQGLKIEKCKFLETSGCVSTCINACKIPTQRFFIEGMGLPVTLQPNITDLSCTFQFGVPASPLIMEKDLLAAPCLTVCRLSIAAAGIETDYDRQSCIGSINHSF